MKMTMKNGFLSLTAAVALAGPLAAQATDVRYDFTVNGGGLGPLGNSTSSGSFSFDNSIIPVGGGLVTGTGLLTGLSFTWDGVSYDSTMANTGGLEFNSSGMLDGVNFGTSCNAFGGCGVTATRQDWDISGFTFVGPFDSASFLYSVGDGQFYTGSVGVSPRLVEAPTPAPVWLLGGTLIGLAARMRKFKPLQQPQLVRLRS